MCAWAWKSWSLRTPKNGGESFSGSFTSTNPSITRPAVLNRTAVVTRGVARTVHTPLRVGGADLLVVGAPA